MAMKVVSATGDDSSQNSALLMTLSKCRIGREAGILIDRLDRTTTRYKMKIGPDKTKVMTEQPKWLPKRDQDKRSEARSGKL